MSTPILPALADLHAAHATTEAARRAALLRGDAEGAQQHAEHLATIGHKKLTAQVRTHVAALAALDQEGARLAADAAPASAAVEAARAAVEAAEREEREAPRRLALATEAQRRAYSAAYSALSPMRNKLAALDLARSEHQAALTALLEGQKD